MVGFQLSVVQFLVFSLRYQEVGGLYILIRCREVKEVAVEKCWLWAALFAEKCWLAATFFI